jgi:phage-related baseplate assembly protein
LRGLSSGYAAGGNLIKGDIQIFSNPNTQLIQDENYDLPVKRQSYNNAARKSIFAYSIGLRVSQKRNMRLTYHHWCDVPARPECEGKSKSRARHA